MEVAVIGAGFCGLAVAWHILQYTPSLPHLKVTLFDAKGIGLGASGVAAGLLHPFSGAHAKLNWRGREGVESTQEMLKIASEAIGRPVTAKNKGILRLALSQDQKIDFQRCAESYPLETEWLDAASCQALAPGSGQGPGLWIKEGLTIYSSLYLQGLWMACESRGAQLKIKTIHSLEELSSFDAVILTTGAESRKIPELSMLPLKSVKGQVLELAWPENHLPLTSPLNSHVYILMTEGGKSCLAGATYEKGVQDDACDLETAKKEILPKAYELYPPLKGAQILNCFAGLRAVGPQHRPLMQRLSPTHWILTGMGSKGLLYHALFAKELVEKLMRSIGLLG